MAALEDAPETFEVLLRRARGALEGQDLAGAARILGSLSERRAAAAVDWRLRWWSGLLALAGGDPDDASQQFRTVAARLPGELAPQLAMGMCAEVLGLAAEGRSDIKVARESWERAAEHYRLVAATDPGLSGASFGAARCLLRLGHRPEAASALARIPSTSAAYASAQIRLCQALSATLGEGESAEEPTLGDLVQASDVLADLEGRDVSPTVLLVLRRDLLAAAAVVAERDGEAAASTEVAATPCRALDIRAEMERTLRRLASLAGSARDRHALVDEANSWRPWTTT
jgi:serine/threonine-protein kinase PknG